MSGRRTWVVAIVVLALVAAACSGDGADEATVIASGAGRSGTVVQALDDALIPVLATPIGDPADRQIRLWDWQVETMTRQYEAGNGWLGADLDDAIGPVGGAPFSYFIAAWLASFDTTNARLAQDLMGDQNWRDAPSIIFPSIVLTLFVDDAVGASAPTSDEGATGVIDGDDLLLAVARVPVAQESGGLCSAVMDFVHDGLQMVFDALLIDSDVPVLSFFTDLLDAVIQLFGDLLTELVEILTAPVAAAISAALGMIHLVTMVADIVQPWTVTVEPSAFVTTFSTTGGPNNQQRFTATVADPLQSTIEIDWPPDVLDCADVFGIELPSFGDDYEDVGVSWFMRWGSDPVLGSATEVEQTFDVAGGARLDWVTGHEPSTDGDEEVGVVVATVVPEITVVDDLEKYAAGLVLGLVPSGAPAAVRALISDLYASVTEPVWESLTELLQPRATTDVRVIHHATDEADAFGPGEWVVIDVTGDVQQEDDGRRVSQSVTFTGSVMQFVVADDGVRGDGHLGRHFSLFIGINDQIVGPQETRLRVRSDMEPMSLQGDPQALRTTGFVDYLEYLNESTVSVDGIGSLQIDSAMLGFGTAVPTTSDTVEAVGVGCGRAGAVVASQRAWVGLRVDVGSLDAVLEAVATLASGNEPPAVVARAVAELADAFADDCVNPTARAGADGVGRMLQQGIG